MDKALFDKSNVYASFHLGEGEFSLGVVHIQEVVNAPSQLTQIPLSPAFVKGLFYLRGCVIPVVDLRHLLKIPGQVQAEDQKIAILEMQGWCIGLLIDKTGEIFRCGEDDLSLFHNQGPQDVVRGVFKKNSGRRIIQLLDIEKLFTLNSVPKDERGNRLGRDLLSQRRGLRKQCISFQVGPARCALGISEIQEILKIENIEEANLSSGHCIGQIDVRGSSIPIIDFTSLLGYREPKTDMDFSSGDYRVIVMKLGDESFGLLVDSVNSIVSYFPDELIKFPMIEQVRSAMFVGCVSVAGQAQILLLDKEQILTNEEINEITHGHSTMYKQLAAMEKAKKQSSGVRKTYITFKINGTYAVGINDVKEIIEYPKELLHPPGLPKHVHGVLNLRGELVTIIDGHRIYKQQEETAPQTTGKVLVFKRNEVHYGLVVDCVDAIVSFADSDKMRLPEMLYRGSVGQMLEDLSEAIEIEQEGGNKRSLLILSVDAITDRVSRSLSA